MSQPFEIAHPAENEIVAPGALRIRGSGPADHKVQVRLMKAGKIVTDGEWKTTYPSVTIGEDWSVHALLITNIPIAPENRSVNFKVI
ncbi:hypothetical protein [Burkholderia ubonensis]|uniref:hypothetical protein n=1 Tax=Burkholderia ubonensis TaxID=101571 RepID=UPI0012FCC5E9|nr:hypothetical protein [Burkholderia ubonensis]